MTDRFPSADPTNPFATRYTRPGAVPFLFPAGRSAEQLVDELARAGWTGAIVGPHGSGKSTLLAALEPVLARRGRRVLRWTLRDGQSALPRGWWRAVGDAPDALVVVDGYEQLGRWGRWDLTRRCRRRGWGLLVTCHQPVGLPTLYRIENRLEDVARVVGALLAGLDANARRMLQVPSDVIAESFHRRGGNCREVLFDLYDWVERNRLAAP